MSGIGISLISTLNFFEYLVICAAFIINDLLCAEYQVTFIQFCNSHNKHNATGYKSQQLLLGILYAKIQAGV
ncbi:hypothetical protein D3C80_2060890 [compost metagenome]